MIVSTPITDVAEPYGEIVYLGDTPERVHRRLRAGAAASRAANAPSRIAKMREVLSRTSWDAHRAGHGGGRSSRPSRSARRRRRAAPRTASREPAGARAGRDRRRPDRPERRLSPGRGLRCCSSRTTASAAGAARSRSTASPSTTPATSCSPTSRTCTSSTSMLLGDNVHWQDREAWIYSKNVYTRYPFQGSLYGLPPEVIKECIIGAIEARFGPLKPPKHRRRATAMPTARRNGKQRPRGRLQDGGRRIAARTASWKPPRRSRTQAATAVRRAAQFRGVHLQGLGRGHRQALRHSVQPQALGGAARARWKPPGWADACRCRISRR